MFLSSISSAIPRSGWELTRAALQISTDWRFWQELRGERSTPPLLSPGDTPGAYDRYGFRVPLIVVSPWAKPNYVSNVVQDHTSITAFIERKWNLPAMTFRDANAQAMTDYFDFSNPAFLKPPPLAKAPALAPGLAACHAQGLNPPLPPGVG